MIPVFIGYDPREAIAYHTCANSIIRNSSKPVAIIPVALNLFKDYTETHTDGSNHFIYTRFLVPYLMKWEGHAIFIDGDMIVRGDIAELWSLKDNPNAKLVHYTLGTPCFHEFADKGNFCNEWHRERVYTEHCQQHDLSK